MEKDKGVGETNSPVRLSVLVVTFNSSQTITSCIKSLIPELNSISGELIVIDNHSTDGTPAILNDLEASYSQMRVVLNRTNWGFAAGNNQAEDSLCKTPPCRKLGTTVGLALADLGSWLLGQHPAPSAFVEALPFGLERYFQGPSQPKTPASLPG